MDTHLDIQNERGGSGKCPQCATEDPGPGAAGVPDVQQHRSWCCVAALLLLATNDDRFPIGKGHLCG